MTNPIRLCAADLIDPITGAHYAFISHFENLFTLAHNHDFYEVFLVAQGTITHHVNGAAVVLDKGTLVLIRPEDVHYFSRYADHDCQIINLAFPVTTMAALLAYLDQDGLTAPVATSELPPTVLLDPADCAHARARLESLPSIPPQQTITTRLAVRALLVELFVMLFPLQAAASDSTPMPGWLRVVCQTMRKPEHFVVGRAALLQLAGKSYEYVGRSFRKYLGITPTEYINHLRLNYAANLLIHTDRPIVDIMFEAGFGNLSHFYHLFNNQWGMTPAQYRQVYRKSFLP
jgi:AraC family cel operon transcriptional repressor